jgi:hypothetical protein
MYDDPFFEQYMACLQWAVAHMFGGSPFLLGVNGIENLYTVVYLIISGLFGSALIAHVANALMRNSMLGMERGRTLFNVRRFLLDHRVPRHLHDSIMTELRERTDKRVMMQLPNVPLIGSLSKALRSELIVELYSRRILNHEFLRGCSLISRTFVPKICETALSQLTLVTAEALFHPGQTAMASSLIWEGNVEYVAPHMEPVIMSNDQWLGEICLWTAWSHKGWARAIVPTDYLLMNVEPFGQALMEENSVWVVVQDYCATLLAVLGQAEEADVTDLPLTMWPLNIDYDAMLVQMPAESAKFLSECAAKSLDQKMFIAAKTVFSFKRKRRADLMKEVRAGSCLLKADDTGKVVRLVSVAVLKLVRNNKQELVEVGQLRKGGEVVKPSCENPGRKIQSSCRPEDVVRSLIEEELTALSAYISIQEVEISTSYSLSSSYGLMTKYVRYVFHAVLLNCEEDATKRLRRQSTAKRTRRGAFMERVESGDRRDSKLRAELLSADAKLFSPEKNGTLRVYAWLHPKVGPSLREKPSFAQLWLERLDIANLKLQVVPSPSQEHDGPSLCDVDEDEQAGPSKELEQASKDSKLAGITFV